MTKKKETTVLLLTLLITIGAIAGGVWWLGRNQLGTITLDRDTEIVPDEDTPVSIVGEGKEILIEENITPEKKAGVKAIANKNYAEAEAYLEQSLSKQRNDPEALIYLNNARIGDNNAYNIAVPVPIGTEMTTSKEILRGVAQAQNEINQQGGINGVALKVLIANDSNNSEVAKQIAQNLVKNKQILGVVGHFSSGVTLATAPIYQDRGLVAISPTSTSVDISGIGNYIFRTVPNDRFTGNALSEYALERINKTQAVVIYNSQSAYSKSLKDSFSTDFINGGGEIAIEADISQSSFNPAEILSQAKMLDSGVIVFLNDSKTVDRAYLVMQLNNNKLPMLAGDSFYKPQTLQNGADSAVGLVLAVPWHISGDVNPDFPQTSRSLWGGDVNWRTAMAYDAVKALAAGLEVDPSRRGIQTTLSQSNFSFDGASGKVKFLASGDRNSAVQLVTVQPGQRSSYSYDFVPLKK